ncbi:hypothetical protein BD413DRAFT_469640 [Trametes elegans]|nr:hypothetical protein BD413DRAFT_469640 [Trametes elegans]
MAGPSGHAHADADAAVPDELERSFEDENEQTDVVLRRGPRLTEDVLIDNVFSRLDTEDIAKLRQVSKQFWECSTEAVVWKRRLERAAHLLPPVPPTERYSIANISAEETERLIVRCSSLARRWAADEPDAQTRWHVDAGARGLSDLVLLPGGQYMVGAVEELSGEPRYAIEVFTADFQYATGAPLARLPTHAKPIELRAKYMTFRGTPGIVIAYICRQIRRSYVHRGLPVDLNSLQVDYDPGPNNKMLRYTCTVVHVPLESLELMGDGQIPQDSLQFRWLARELKGPFHILTEIISLSRLSNPAIDDDVNGMPLVAVLKHVEGVPDRIVYKNLDGGLATTLILEPNPNIPPEMPQSIMNFCILPIQNQLLVIRKAGSVDEEREVNNPEEDMEDTFGPLYSAEFYDIVHAPTETLTQAAASRSLVHDAAGNKWTKVWISDHGLGPALAHDRSLRPQLLAGARPALKPITIFIQMRWNDGITYSIIHPAGHPLAGAPTGPAPAPECAAGTAWALTDEVLQFDRDALLGDRDGARGALGEVRVLPGAARPLVYVVPRAGRTLDRCDMRDLTALWDSVLLGEDVDLSGGEFVQEVRMTAVHVADEELRGVSAIAWDDTIGRLCVAYAGKAQIAVFDFAAAPLREHDQEYCCP